MRFSNSKGRQAPGIIIDPFPLKHPNPPDHATAQRRRMETTQSSPYYLTATLIFHEAYTHSHLNAAIQR
ncbi:hypothetical protein VTJ04DRAFT_9468 [Mycothermus thermophilus]|uniref:uncharacterized protein n=1 Tax=Humicola insolens TaxID=85995 RepID=UPI0037437426